MSLLESSYSNLRCNKVTISKKKSTNKFIGEAPMAKPFTKSTLQ